MFSGTLLAKKLGMTSLYDAQNNLVALTVLHVLDCSLLRVKTKEVDGYESLVVGYGRAKQNRMSKPHLGIFAKNNLSPKGFIKEFRVNRNSKLPELKPGATFTLESFSIVPNQLVDVTAVSKGKGFSGVMKRHNFAGLEASHGVSASHRSGGSTGGCQDPGRVFKNKKMAGQLGAKQVTTQNLKIFSIDEAKGLILLQGPVPGPKNGLVKVRDAVKKRNVQ